MNTQPLIHCERVDIYRSREGRKRERKEVAVGGGGSG